MPSPLTSPRLRALAAALILVAATGLVAGCGGSSKPSAHKTPQGPGMKPSENIATAGAFFTALGAGDPASLATATADAAKGSRAAEYVGYLTDLAAARSDAQITTSAGTVSATADAGYRICVKPTSCATYDAIVLADGKVSSFDVAGKPIATRVGAGSGATVRIGSGGTAEYSSWYQAGRSLVVNVKLTASGGPLTLAVGDLDYTDRSGHQYDATGLVGPTKVAAGSSATYSVTFVGASGGGSLGLHVGSTPDVTLRIR
jgi:hypothetical protein